LYLKKIYLSHLIKYCIPYYIIVLKKTVLKFLKTTGSIKLPPGAGYIFLPNILLPQFLLYIPHSIPRKHYSTHSHKSKYNAESLKKNHGVFLPERLQIGENCLTPCNCIKLAFYGRGKCGPKMLLARVDYRKDPPKTIY